MAVRQLLQINKNPGKKAQLKQKISKEKIIKSRPIMVKILRRNKKESLKKIYRLPKSIILIMYLHQRSFQTSLSLRLILS